jgi:hypothetical protein
MDRRKEIAERWWEALLTLKSNRTIKTYREFERATGIDNQRINSIRIFVEKNGPPAYAQPDYIAAMHDEYGVSNDWMLNGEGEMFKKDNETLGTPRSANQTKSLKLPAGFNLIQEVLEQGRELSELRKQVDRLKRGQ